HRLLRRERIDILHAHCFLANVAGRVVGRLAGARGILTAHHDTDVWMGLVSRFVERQTARLGAPGAARSPAGARFAPPRHPAPPRRAVWAAAHPRARAPRPLPPRPPRAGGSPPPRGGGRPGGPAGPPGRAEEGAAPLPDRRGARRRGRAAHALRVDRRGPGPP